MKTATAVQLLALAVFLGLAFVLFRQRHGGAGAGPGVAGLEEHAPGAEPVAAEEGRAVGSGGRVEATGSARERRIVDTAPVNGGPTARIRGRVHVGARAVPGATVSVGGAGSAITRTDRRGRFEIGDLPPNRDLQVRVTGDVPLTSRHPSTLDDRPTYLVTLVLDAGEVRDLDVDFTPIAVRVEVADRSTGRPVPGARIAVLPMDPHSLFQLTESSVRIDGNARWDAETGEEGEADVWVSLPGPYRISARAQGFVASGTRTDVPESRITEPVRLELTRAVPCAGRVAVPPEYATPTRPGFILARIDGEKQTSLSEALGGLYPPVARLYPPDFSFELDGLSEGRYRASIVIDKRSGREASFELGPYGDRNLILDFVPGE